MHRFGEIADRVAVVDTETTGVYNSDRVVEVAVVTLALDGRVVDEWDTLIDPQRDVGPSWLHGITAGMVAGAPTFEDVADELAARLHGALVCAHNLPFDSRMLRNEFRRLDVDLDMPGGLDTLAASGTKLGVACEEHRIALTGAHCALHDARATGQLLFKLADWFDGPLPARFLTPLTSASPTARWHRTGDELVTAPPSYLAELAAQVIHRTDDAPLAAYLDLLDRAMADLRLDEFEQAELVALAVELGLDVIDVSRAHLRWMDDLIATARADGVVDGQEYDQLLRAAFLLGVDADRVHSRTARERSRVEHVRVTVGMGVCFTGDATGRDGELIPREDLQDVAAALGLRVEDSFTKSRCQLLIAADVATSSTKADKARRWGIPIIAVTDLLSTVSLPASFETVSIEAGVRKAIRCVGCGTVYTHIAQVGAKATCPECSAVHVGRRGSV